MKKRHKQIRDYIVQYTIDHGYPPTIEEIAEGVGLKSKSSVFEYLWSMDRLGIIKMVPGQPRCISVPGVVIEWREPEVNFGRKENEGENMRGRI